VAISEMAVPFGFSVGDFLVVSKLIRQVVVELREVRAQANIILGLRSRLLLRC
jgi:hypothetical protein